MVIILDCEYQIQNLGFLKLKYKCKIPLANILSNPDFCEKSHSFLTTLNAISLYGGPALKVIKQKPLSYYSSIFYR